MSTLFLIAATLAAQGALAAERWIEIGRDSKQTEYVDPQSVDRKGPWRLVWTRVDFSAPQADGAWSAWFRIEIHCARRTYALVAFVGRDRDGRTISQGVVAHPVRERITPHTGSQTVRDIACSRRAR